jgi:hypothetical protein
MLSCSQPIYRGELSNNKKDDEAHKLNMSHKHTPDKRWFCIAGLLTSHCQPRVAADDPNLYRTVPDVGASMPLHGPGEAVSQVGTLIKKLYTAKSSQVFSSLFWSSRP